MDFHHHVVALRRSYPALYQDMVDRFGCTAGDNSVKRFDDSVEAQKQEQLDRLEFGPSDEVQVDYG
ncbi:hypothetical protein [Duganella alba]|uniref:hypothetical protein n=1 Tax=Duganella alba TaxID=2666081 RepID=UPI001409E835|nr:hypothetical protein [Duganella alba]